MRDYRTWLASSLGFLIAALCCAALAAADPMPPPMGGRAVHVTPPSGPSGILNSYAVVPPSPAQPTGAPSAGLRLPVHVAPWMPLRLAQGGETFYRVTFPLDYRSGPVTLAGDAAGTRNSSVDDQMIMKVTHPDGTVSTYQDKEFAETLAPMDLSKYFQKGVNTVEVTLRDVYGDVMSATDLWLTDKRPAPARLPLLLLEGVVPESAWPAAAATVTVTGPPRGQKVTLSGDREGGAGTWATGQLTIRVTHADGSTKEASYDYASPEGPPKLRPPVDVTSLFGPGVNTVELGISSGAVASSAIWLALVKK